VKWKKGRPIGSGARCYRQADRPPQERGVGQWRQNWTKASSNRVAQGGTHGRKLGDFRVRLLGGEGGNREELRRPEGHLASPNNPEAASQRLREKKVTRGKGPRVVGRPTEGHRRGCSSVRLGGKGRNRAKVDGGKKRKGKEGVANRVLC